MNAVTDLLDVARKSVGFAFDNGYTCGLDSCIAIINACGGDPATKTAIINSINTLRRVIHEQPTADDPPSA